MPLATQVPGLPAIAAGWMIAWYVVWLTRFGNALFGDLSRNWTVYGPVLTTPDGSRRLNGIAERSSDVFSVRYCLKLATTSAAVIVLPWWNLTPRRSWNVQTVRSALGFQLVASHGFTCRALFENVRNSPGMPARASEPASLSRYGSTLEANAVKPTRSVPPLFCDATERAP